jgi:hypothetical protein
VSETIPLTGIPARSTLRAIYPYWMTNSGPDDAARLDGELYTVPWQLR